jgi:hypothetical protein
VIRWAETAENGHTEVRGGGVGGCVSVNCLKHFNQVKKWFESALNLLKFVYIYKKPKKTTAETSLWVLPTIGIDQELKNRLF